MNAHHVPQGLLDRLQSTGAPSDPKTSGKPTGPKSPVKAPVKAAAQPEAVTSPDAPAGPPPADLIIAARLHLSQVHPHTRSSTCHLCQMRCSSTDAHGVYMSMSECHSLCTQDLQDCCWFMVIARPGRCAVSNTAVHVCRFCWLSGRLQRHWSRSWQL
jgi:hypothetical protein